MSLNALDKINLHGWDSSAQDWHGPDELTFSLAGCANIVRKLRQLPGSWYGTLQEECAGELPVKFAASIQDLGDAGLGIVDLDGSPRGPAHIVLVVPSQRRVKLRPEFAFEFTSYAKFLSGAEAAGWELAIHNYIEKVLAGPADSGTAVFSIETPHAAPELKLHFAQSAGKLAMSMIASMADRDQVRTPRSLSEPKRRASRPAFAPGSLSAVYGRSDRSTSRGRLEYHA